MCPAISNRSMDDMVNKVMPTTRTAQDIEQLKVGGGGGLGAGVDA